MPETEVIARIPKDQLDDLRIRRNAVVLLKAQYLLAQRGWGAQIGELLRKFRRSDEEKLRLNLETGDVEVVPYEETRPAMTLTDMVAKDILNGSSQPTLEP